MIVSAVILGICFLLLVGLFYTLTEWEKGLNKLDKSMFEEVAVEHRCATADLILRIQDEKRRQGTL